MSARAGGVEAMRIACRGRPAATDVNVHAMGEAKMNIRKARSL
jgi:hypothetical protein